MNKVGIQWQRETDAVLDYNRLVQPTILKSINCHAADYPEIHQLSHSALLAAVKGR